MVDTVDCGPGVVVKACADVVLGDRVKLVVVVETVVSCEGVFGRAAAVVFHW